MKHFIVVLICFLNSAICFSQSFQKEIGGSVIKALVKSNSDIGVSFITSFQMFDQAGISKWALNYNGQYSIKTSEESSDNSVILCGDNFLGSSTGNFVIIKKDSSGNTVWSKFITDTNINVCHLEGSLSFHGGVILFGKGVYQNNWRTMISYIDSSGALIWGKILNFSFNYPLKAIRTRADEFIFASGNYFLKMDSLGNVIWMKTISLPDFDFKSVAETKTGNYSLLMESDTGMFSIALTDTSGTFINGQTYYTSINFVDPQDLEYLADSSLVIFGGAMENINSICQYTFIHTDKNLNLLSSSYLELSIHCSTPSNLTATDNGFVATGNESFDGWAHVIKVDNPDSIDCSIPFQVTNNPMAISFPNGINAFTTDLFTISSFVDSSVLTNLFYNTYCGNTQLSHIDNSQIKIYPNPFQNSFTIENIAEDSKIMIRDYLGRDVPVIIHHNENNISINFLCGGSGIYYITVQTGSNVISGKMIKVN